MMNLETNISIIVPVFNAELYLNQTIDKILLSLNKLNLKFEIILIDDASTDKTWSVIKKIKTVNPLIKAIRFNRNYGQHNALLCGIKESFGKYIVTIDDDLEHNPEDIIVLYNSIKNNNYDLVYGMPVNPTKNIFRKLITKIYKKVSQIENKKAGEGSSFRILKKELNDKLLQHNGSLFFIDEIALWYTDNIGYEKVKFQKSLRLKSGYKFGQLFTLSLRVLSLSSTMPLKLVRVLGLYISVFSIFLGCYFFIKKFIQNVPMGYTSLMVAILFSSGIITFSLGIIGEYIGNLISLSNKKPSYSIKEKI